MLMPDLVQASGKVNLSFYCHNVSLKRKTHTVSIKNDAPVISLGCKEIVCRVTHLVKSVLENIVLGNEELGS